MSPVTYLMLKLTVVIYIQKPVVNIKSETLLEITLDNACCIIAAWRQSFQLTARFLCIAFH